MVYKFKRLIKFFVWDFLTLPSIISIQKTIDRETCWYILLYRSQNIRSIESSSCEIKSFGILLVFTAEMWCWWCFSEWNKCLLRWTNVRRTRKSVWKIQKFIFHSLDYTWWYKWQICRALHLKFSNGKWLSFTTIDTTLKIGTVYFVSQFETFSINMLWHVKFHFEQSLVYTFDFLKNTDEFLHYSTFQSLF